MLSALRLRDTAVDIIVMNFEEMKMEVETKNASLDTLAVTIQALHVNGKQMTLAVFRQLPIALAYTEDGGLVGGLNYWGLVNYDIKNEGRVWLVASNEGVLYRCDAMHVSHMFNCSPGAWLAEAARAENEADCIEEDRAKAAVYREWSGRRSAAEREYMKNHPQEAALPPWMTDLGEWIKEKAGPEPEHAYFGFQKENRIKELNEIAVRSRENAKRSARAKESTLKILSLPQLFIAV